MSRFSSDDRRELPNRICTHFDKYCEIINPVPFDPIKDIYIPSMDRKDWEALNVLMDSKYKKELLNRGYNFELYIDDQFKKSNYQRPHITFGFPEGQPRLPSLELELYHLPIELRDKVQKWTSKAVALRKLRSKLWKRLEQVLDHGWDARKSWDSYRGSFRGGPTSGQGVNTAGQLQRIWPEVLPYLPLEYRDSVRGAQVKSRLPNFIVGWGTPAQFMLLERPYRYNEYNPDDDPALDQREPFTDEEWATEKRMLEGINHILTQMSLIKDVPQVKGYPSVTIQGR